MEELEGCREAWREMGEEEEMHPSRDILKAPRAQVEVVAAAGSSSASEVVASGGPAVMMAGLQYMKDSSEEEEEEENRLPDRSGSR